MNRRRSATTATFALVALLLTACGGMQAAAPTTGSPESITNNQVDGVDEGDIVKAHGDHLLVLRRGRLFSVDVSDGVRPVSRVDVPDPDIEPGWYDEMLVRGDSVIVLGYNYGQRASEIALFDIDARGHLSRRGTFFLRSDDYYSSRNYASRRIGDQLVFYMPYHVGRTPELRHENGPWQTIRTRHHPIASPSRAVLHTVVSCDLSAPELRCDARGVTGGWGRTFYVSRSGVYVWVQEGAGTHGGPDAVVYRLPFDADEAPSGLRAWGMPVDQLSFHEDDGDALNVVVRSSGYGDRMWGPEWSAGDTALLRISLSAFSAESPVVDRSAYRRLHHIEGYAMQNRFVGDHVLYGAGQQLGVTAYRGPGEHVDHLLQLDHDVERIDSLGGAAVVIGADDSDLRFSAISLDALPRVVGHHVERDAAQGETRTHGFFFHRIEGDDGILGLPVREARSWRWDSLFRDSAGVLFLEVDEYRFRDLGRLEASAGQVDDRCVASCVDWYGNARPIFYRGRIFALLGYELVEGRLTREGIREVDRATFL